MKTVESLLSEGPPSPKFPLLVEEFGAIKDSLDTIGHVIIENCFSHRDIEEILKYARRMFDQLDDSRESEQAPEEALISYYSGTYDLNPFNNALLVEMVHRSRLPNLLTFLYGLKRRWFEGAEHRVGDSLGKLFPRPLFTKSPATPCIATAPPSTGQRVDPDCNASLSCRA